MKKFILLAVMIFAIVIGIIVFAFCGQRPFGDLKASDIVSASVHLVPPDKTIQILEVHELVSHLKDVVVYNKDSSYHNYCGQGVTYLLVMSDGNQAEITAYNPFVIINGVGYRTKYEPCEKLNYYANKLLSTISD